MLEMLGMMTGMIIRITIMNRVRDHDDDDGWDDD